MHWGARVSIHKGEEELQAPTPNHGQYQQFSYQGDRQWEWDFSLCIAGRYVGAITGPWPWSVLSRYPAQGLCLLSLPERYEFLGSCYHLKSPLQAPQKLLSWLTGHVLGCYPWAGWFMSGCWQRLRSCLPTEQSNKMFNSSPPAIV